jgi:tRNA nucleotidyltransferase (CCA-adding enzyme)
MQVYLVGGAVRDELLGLPPHERDWVVVGATPAEMERLGYRAVGRDFPVFLHPRTQEEYALARLERKSGSGHTGFKTEFAPTVTLEEDLIRRDLTINAMARSDAGILTDPYGGQRDLAARVLRHVSPAFVEDPLRVLRVARFAARFAALGFIVAPETLNLMQQIGNSGELAALTPERVWRELERALSTSQPLKFFEVLHNCGAMLRLFPECGPVLQSAEAATRACGSLRAAAASEFSNPVRWSAFVAELDEPALAAAHARLRAPNEYSELAELACRLSKLLRSEARLPEENLTTAEQLLALLEAADAFRRPERFEAWLQVAQARATGSDVPLSVIALLTDRVRRGLATAAAVKLDTDGTSELKGPQIGERIRSQRLAALAKFLSGASQ